MLRSRLDVISDKGLQQSLSWSS